MGSVGVLIAVYALIVLGLILCFVGRFPGQILAYAGMLVAAFATDIHPYPTWLLILCGVLVVVSLIVNKALAPKLAGKVHEFGKAGRWGTIIGSILSLCILPAISSVVVGIILFVVFPYIFAFLFEMIANKDAKEGLKRGAGAYTLYLSTTFINIAICAFCFMEVLCGWI